MTNWNVLLLYFKSISSFNSLWNICISIVFHVFKMLYWKQRGRKANKTQSHFFSRYILPLKPKSIRRKNKIKHCLLQSLWLLSQYIEWSTCILIQAFYSLFLWNFIYAFRIFLSNLLFSCSIAGIFSVIITYNNQPLYALKKKNEWFWPKRRRLCVFIFFLFLKSNCNVNKWMVKNNISKSTERFRRHCL